MELLQSVCSPLCLVFVFVAKVDTRGCLILAEVRFKEHGVDAIEVQDNGRGIEQADWSSIGSSCHDSRPNVVDD